MDKELSKFFHLTFSRCYLLYSDMVHAPLHVIRSLSPPWLCGLMQQAPRNFWQSILLWLKQRDLEGALAPGSQLPLGLTKIFLLAEGVTRCRELSRRARPSACSSRPGLPTVSPSWWFQPTGLSLLQIHPSIFCSLFTALGTLNAAQSWEHFMGSMEILGARDPGCERWLQSPGFTIH